jgi:NSS family neurotransmitter:Na+ symporter
MVLIVLIVRALTLPGAAAGLSKYIGSFSFKHINGTVMAAALGQAIFSLSLGGTFMVIYGSYMSRKENILRNSIFTGIGDLMAGLLAGLAIFPAVFAFNLHPDSGPNLIFVTLPKIFAQIPVGWFFAFLFFIGLWGAAYISDVAAFEVLVSGITDNTRFSRPKAVGIVCVAVFCASILPMLNFKIFIPWDLVFGSGMQILGSLLAVITVVWCIQRSRALQELAEGSGKSFPKILFWWIRIVIPSAILFVGINWLLEKVF